VSCKKKHKTESNNIDTVLYYYISSGNQTVMTNTRVRLSVLRPGLSAGLPLSDISQQYILNDGVNFQSCDIVLGNLLRHNSQFFSCPVIDRWIALQKWETFYRSRPSIEETVGPRRRRSHCAAQFIWPLFTSLAVSCMCAILFLDAAAA